MNLDTFKNAADLTRWMATQPVRRVRSGQTPHAIVHRQGKAALRFFPPYRGEPVAGRPVHRPLFISMPLINMWTVFDLLPKRSVVEALVDSGRPVYLLDWGKPGPEDAAMKLCDVIDNTLRRALDRTQRDAAKRDLKPELDALGYCVGGTFLAIALSRYPVARSMTLLAAPIDFHASGRLALWARPDTFPLDDIVDGLGNFPKDWMAASFAWLRPMGQISKYKSLLDRFDKPGFADTWAAMERWSQDNTDFPGEAYREYVRRCYFDNALMDSASWQLGGQPVDLSQGKVPALVLAASNDHICPPKAALGLQSVWGGSVTTQTLSGGHVGVCLGKALPTAINEWLS